jgi:hypothetical protein
MSDPITDPTASTSYDQDWRRILDQQRDTLNAETGQAILAAIGQTVPDLVATETTFTIDPPVTIKTDVDAMGVELASVTIVVTRYNGNSEDDAEGGIRLSGHGYHLKSDGTRDARRGLSPVYLSDRLPIVAPLLLQAMMRSPYRN